MTPGDKARRNLIGKHLYHKRKDNGQTIGIGEYIGKVIAITSGFSVMVKTKTEKEPISLSIIELNKKHRNGDIAILQKSIR